MATEIKSTSIKSQNIIAEPQANKPGSPETGQIIQATGTGDIAKGIYHYSGAAWMSLDNAQGDLETLRLIMSTDTDAVGFSSALNSTSTLAGNTNVVPHETSTGTGMLGALEVPSTGGDALLTEFDANKVFRYFSAGANNNNDYFGIPIDIPAQSRGHSIVIKFKYRTEEASADTSNGDFQVSVWDKTNGVKTTSTDTSSKSAGDAITVASSTGMAVGDKIWLESGGQSTIGNVAATLTQAYITEVVNSTSIKISEDWTPATASGSLVVTGWLSDKTSGLLPSADSDTNKVGKDFSIAVKTEEDTEQIVLWISNKSTTTNVIELFFDGILVSQNKFLQANTKIKDEAFVAIGANLYSSDDTRIPYYSTETVNTTNHLVNLVNSTSTGLSAEILEDCFVSGTLKFKSTGTGEMFGWSKNATSTEVDANIHTISGARMIALTHPTGANYDFVSFAQYFQKGDIIRPHGGNLSTTFTDTANYTISLNFLSNHNESVILESQDEIFTDWQDYTPTTSLTGGTISTQKGKWRRVGDTMEVEILFEWSSIFTGGTAVFTLPSGYSIDTSKIITPLNSEETCLGDVVMNDSGTSVPYYGKVGYNDTTSVKAIYHHTINGNVYLAAADNITTSLPFTWANNDSILLKFRVPISGFNANFNPLLSMPLQDFSSLENTFSARITSTGVLTSQSGNWISSSTRDSVGNYTITLVSGFFSVTPSAVIDANEDVSGGAMSWIRSIDTSTIQIRIGEDGVAYRDRGFSITVTRQGSDYRQAPQATAAVIKPAVAILNDLIAAGGGGQSITTSFADINMTGAKGETWFFNNVFQNGTSGASGTNSRFELKPGTYELEGRIPMRNQTTRYGTARFFNHTSSSIIGERTSMLVSDSGTAYEGVTMSVYATVTLTVNSVIALQMGASVAGGDLGNDYNIDSTVYTGSQIKIRKLK